MGRRLGTPVKGVHGGGGIVFEYLIDEKHCMMNNLVNHDAIIKIKGNKGPEP